MNAQHTPAPWHVEWSMRDGGEAHTIVDNRDMLGLSVIATVHFHDDTEGETKANARLIAAAPELLEALNLALEYWRHRQQRYKNRSPVWVQAARAAIAKATGEQV